MGAVTSMEPNEGTFVLHNENTKVKKELHFGVMFKNVKCLRDLKYIASVFDRKEK